MRYRYQIRGTVYEIQLERRGKAYQAVFDGKPYEFEILDEQPGEISLLFAGKPITLYWAEAEEKKWVSQNGCTYLIEKPAPCGSHIAGGQAVADVVRAPMPAQVRSVMCREGDEVEKGEPVLLLEAMKMEIRITAPRTGRIQRLNVAEGQSVEKDQVLLELEPVQQNTEPEHS